jgi:hypothetical protein
MAQSMWRRSLLQFSHDPCERSDRRAQGLHVREWIIDKYTSKDGQEGACLIANMVM